MKLRDLSFGLTTKNKEAEVMLRSVSSLLWLDDGGSSWGIRSLVTRGSFRHSVKGRFRLIDNANMDKLQSREGLQAMLKPSLSIFDQVDKIKGFAADREDLRLGAIYIWARELAKTYCPVIGVCQADGSAENQKWLTMENVANAKTS
jgi:hypothetical protein